MPFLFLGAAYDCTGPSPVAVSDPENIDFLMREHLSSISSGEKIDLTSASTIHAIRSASSSGVIEETSVQPADLLFLGREVHFCLKKFINTPSVKKNIRASIYGGSTC